jgi:hypothetical protein
MDAAESSFLDDYAILRPRFHRLPAAMLEDIDWLAESLTHRPHLWARAWEARMEVLASESAAAWDKDRRSVWWDSLAVAKKHRRGKEWSALSALFVHSAVPEMPDGDGWGLDAGAAAMDAAGDCAAALVAYSEASSLLEAAPDAVKFLLLGGNPVAMLMYAAVIVRHMEAV